MQVPEKKQISISVRYSNGTVALVRRFPALVKPGMNDFKELYQELLQYFVHYNSSMGELLSDPSVVSLLKAIAEMLPVVGSNKTGINLDDLLDNGDWEQICQLFFTSSMQDDGEFEVDKDGEIKAYKPSKLAKLNQLDFFGRLGKALKHNREQGLAALKTEPVPTSNGSGQVETQKLIISQS